MTPSRRVVAALTCVALSVASACWATNTTDAAAHQLKGVGLFLAATTIEVGQFDTATAVGLDQNDVLIPTAAPTFTSDSPEIAGVSPTLGLILAISPGTTTITGSIAGLASQHTITVVRAPEIRINEIQSNGDSPGGWIEFYNPTTLTVDLSGWIVTDNDLVDTYTFPPHTTIRAGGYLVLDEGRLPFGLEATDDVHLFSRFGVHVDGYSWPTKAATTYGRCPDGVGELGTTVAPTRGVANSCPPAPSPARARVVP